MKSGRLGGILLLLVVVLTACGMRSGEGRPPAESTQGASADNQEALQAAAALERVRRASAAAELPLEYEEALITAGSGDWRALEAELTALTALDPFLWIPVDKTFALPEGYEPEDLRELTGPSYRVNRPGHLLRAAAAEALERMSAAARREGITLVASSAYRSFTHQAQVYARVVARLGQKEADRVSARPGHSEHQLGLALDFGSIDDTFTQTDASKWLAANAGRFGWILSYPEGLEHITGYRFESWHYRYVGLPLEDFIRRRFGGIKHHAFRFLYRWAEES